MQPQDIVSNLPYLHYRGRCSLEFCLLIKEKQAYRGAARDVTYTAIPGRDGDLITDNGRFKNITVTYKTAFVNTTDRTTAEIAREAKSWLLSETGYFPLTDSYDPDAYRMASYIEETEIEEDMRGVGDLTLKFKCKPFKRLFAGDEPIAFTEPGVLVNTHAFPAAPLVRIAGSGDFTLSVGGGTYVFAGVEDEITLDSETMTAYKGNASCMRQMKTPAFPKLEPGENAVSWSGNVSKVEITPRWRTL